MAYSLLNSLVVGSKWHVVVRVDVRHFAGGEDRGDDGYVVRSLEIERKICMMFDSSL